MMRAGLAALSLAALPTAPAVASPPADWRPDISAARVYAAKRPGTVAFAVRTETRLWGVGHDRVFPSASVLKAMLLVAYTRAARDQTRFFLAIDTLLPPRHRGDERVSVAVLTAGNGSHTAGKQTLEGVFRRLLDGLTR